jgi:hypothetical protein
MESEQQPFATSEFRTAGTAAFAAAELQSSDQCDFLTILGAMLKDCCDQPVTGSASDLVDECVRAVLPLANGQSLNQTSNQQLPTPGLLPLYLSQ